MFARDFSLDTLFSRVDRLAENGWPHSGQVALAWNNATADRKRLFRAGLGIGFAAFLIFVQIGFREAFLESTLVLARAIDGDLVMMSSTHHQLGFRDPFERRRMYQALAVPGVVSASPIFMETTLSRWKNVKNGRTYGIRAIGFDPDRPPLSLPGVRARLEDLKQPNTVMMDNRARRHLGDIETGMETELAGRAVRVVGTFPFGPDFFIDGTIFIGERNFIKFFDDPEDPGAVQRNVEFGAIKVKPGYSPLTVRDALTRTLPEDVKVLTKQELVDKETKFQSKLSPVGPIFGLGTVIGFCVGILIAYQVLFTEISDRLPQYATMKAMGYKRRYLMGVIARQSLFYSLAGFIPACAISLVLFAILNRAILIPMQMSLGNLTITLLMTLLMGLVAGLIAARRALNTDPAEVF